MIASARGIGVSYGHTHALTDVDVEVGAGSIVAVVGGDGAGKSTLLRALVREIPVDTGTVVAPGKREIGFLPDGPGSWAALTVRQNLEFVGGTYGLAGEGLALRCTDMIARAGLTHASDRPAAALSGGMRRKLGVAMAMIHRPSFIVLDEPTTGVDPVSRVDMWRMVSQAAAEGAGVILATTYLDEAERAGELLVLDDGHTLVHGAFDDVRAGFPGTITVDEVPARTPWSWRRGRARHEYWPPGTDPGPRNHIEPDLEDIVIALSLRRRLVVTS